ncbi:hypothetical protein BMF94_6386 [Rhodotorula taiwanensis]|uniref:Uncharacterized protein n=1 Tax=Rhodotorula taiwanensis TaxID=741276 RepID=A0A2S5B1E8_9BASI|nr:hypothetical protein BMF94_6386 [Rhodotorula taiwanensis]
MTHWIAFPRPPTTAEVYAAREQGYKRGGWSDRTYPVARPRPQVNNAPTPRPRDTRAPAESNVRAAISGGSTVGDEEEPDFGRAYRSFVEEGIPEADRHLFQHAHDLARLRERDARAGDTTEESSARDEEELDPDLHFQSDLAPPPAQKRRRSSQPPLAAVDFTLDFSRDSDELSRAPQTAGPSFLDHSRFTGTRTDDSYEQTFRSQADHIGGAPEFPFRKRQLVPLNELHAVRDPKQLVSVLAAVWDNQERDTSRGRLCEWSLVDSSGHSCPFARWLDDYSADAEQVRLGDVVFLGSVSVKSWMDKPQLNFRKNTTQIKICWRTRVIDAEDAAYRFHRDWASEIPEAAAVIQEAEAAEAKLL